MTGTNFRESQFVETCTDYNLMPLVLSATHVKGNISILHIVFTL